MERTLEILTLGAEEMVRQEDGTETWTVSSSYTIKIVDEGVTTIKPAALQVAVDIALPIAPQVETAVKTEEGIS